MIKAGARLRCIDCGAQLVIVLEHVGELDKVGDVLLARAYEARWHEVRRFDKAGMRRQEWICWGCAEYRRVTVE